MEVRAALPVVPLAFFLVTDSPRSKLGAKSNWRAGSGSFTWRLSLGLL